MKTSYHLPLIALLTTTALAQASVSNMQVVVTTGAGKVVSQAQTDANGAFTSQSLAPGDYVVRFSSHDSRSGSFAIVVEAGKNVVVAEAVPGGKFAKGGVATKVAVNKPTALKGHIGTGSVAQLRANSIVNPMMSGRVKFINGKKYVWIYPSTGSNLGGGWEQRSAERRALG